VAVTDITSLTLDGKTPAAVRGTLFGPNLLAIAEKKGGICRFAVGHVWRRLAAKVACSATFTTSTRLRSSRRRRGSSPYRTTLRRQHGKWSVTHKDRLPECVQRYSQGRDFGSSRQTFSRALAVRGVNIKQSVVPPVLTICAAFGGRGSARKPTWIALFLSGHQGTSGINAV
jgi:hypothetical protein